MSSSKAILVVIEEFIYSKIFIELSLTDFFEDFGDCRENRDGTVVLEEVGIGLFEYR